MFVWVNNRFKESNMKPKRPSLTSITAISVLQETSLACKVDNNTLAPLWFAGMWPFMHQQYMRWLLTHLFIALLLQINNILTVPSYFVCPQASLPWCSGFVGVQSHTVTFSRGLRAPEASSCSRWHQVWSAASGAKVGQAVGAVLAWWWWL